jgi:MoxR-like ATPase
VDPQVILRGRELARQVVVERKIEDCVLDIVFASREPAAHGMPELEDLIAYGASPRASIYLLQAARALAFLRKRGYVVPDDIKVLAHDVLRHRISPTFEAEAEEIDAEEIVTRILNKVEVP